MRNELVRALRRQAGRQAGRQDHGLEATAIKAGHSRNPSVSEWIAGVSFFGLQGKCEHVLEGWKAGDTGRRESGNAYLALLFAGLWELHQRQRLIASCGLTWLDHAKE